MKTAKDTVAEGIDSIIYIIDQFEFSQFKPNDTYEIV